MKNVFETHNKLQWTQEDHTFLITDANVVRNPADEEISDALPPEVLLQVGVSELLVVEEGRVGVDDGVHALVNLVRLGVDLSKDAPRVGLENGGLGSDRTK